MTNIKHKSTEYQYANIWQLNGSDLTISEQ